MLSSILTCFLEGLDRIRNRFFKRVVVKSECKWVSLRYTQSNARSSYFNHKWGIIERESDTRVLQIEVLKSNLCRSRHVWLHRTRVVEKLMGSPPVLFHSDWLQVRTIVQLKYACRVGLLPAHHKVATTIKLLLFLPAIAKLAPER